MVKPEELIEKNNLDAETLAVDIFSYISNAKEGEYIQKGRVYIIKCPECLIDGERRKVLEKSGEKIAKKLQKDVKSFGWRLSSVPIISRGGLQIELIPTGKKKKKK